MRLIRSIHLVELELLPGPKIKIGQVNSIKLKLDSTIILIFILD